MLNVGLNEVKNQLMEYLHFDYSTLENFINSNNIGLSAYKLDEALILQTSRPFPFKGQVYDYKVFNFNTENTDKFIEQLNLNDFVFFYSDVDIISDSLLFLDKEIYLEKEITEIVTDSNVFEITADDKPEVMEFINSSEVEENDNEALSVIRSIKFIFEEEASKNNEHKFYFIKNENKIIGITQVTIRRMLKNKASIANIYISQKFRGKGFGKRLLTASLTEKNYSYSYNCHKSNSASLQTAISSGFQKSGINSVYIRK